MTVAPRQLFLRTFLVFLVLTALVAIGAVLQAEWGETTLRVLGTSATIAFMAVCGLVGGAALERGRWPAFARATIVLAVLAGLAISAAIWINSHNELGLRCVITIGVAAVASAHGLLLWLPKLPARHRQVQVLSSVFILALAMTIDVVVWADMGGSGADRAITVLAIVVALLTVAIPLLARGAGASSDAAAQRLVLRPLGGNLYADERGQCYRVEVLPQVLTH